MSGGVYKARDVAHLVNFAVIAFVVFVLADGLAMIQNSKTDPLSWIHMVGVRSLPDLLVLSLGLTWLGHQNARESGICSVRPDPEAGLKFSVRATGRMK